MSRSTWREVARAAIHRVHLRLPEDGPLKDRIAAVDAAYPFGARSHWPYRAWCKARREYLGRYGWKPRGQAPTPMERFLAERPRDPVTGRPVI
jgi:hypothetical protein